MSDTENRPKTPTMETWRTSEKFAACAEALSDRFFGDVPDEAWVILRDAPSWYIDTDILPVLVAGQVFRAWWASDGHVTEMGRAET